MNSYLLSSHLPPIKLQRRLFIMAFAFLFTYSLILTLSPAVRLHSWEVQLKWNHWIIFSTWVICFSLLFRFSSKELPDADPILLPCCALLSGWGALTCWRLDPVLGMKQAIWLIVSAAAFWFTLRLPNLPGHLKQYKYVWLLAALLLTLFTFFLGTYPGGEGPRLWLGWGGIFLQPSELLRVLLIVYLAAYLADKAVNQMKISQFLLPTVVVVGIAVILLIAQRDLGTASLLVLVYSVLLYTATGKHSILLISGLIVILSGIAGYFIFDVIQLRMAAWVNPWLDPSGRSYQIVQSIIAIASGKFLGSGPGMGNPSVVPVSHSDFIFSAITEETGLVGAIGILIIICIILNRSLIASLRSSNPYHRYLASGLATHLGLQSLLIIGGNIRLLPLTGLTLPFVSYGGSSLLSSYFALGLLVRISAQPDENIPTTQNPFPIQLISSILFIGFGLCGIVTGWWSIVRSDDLLSRYDNPRRTINDLYVKRGSFLDRNNTPIVVSEGSAGSYERIILFPDLSPVVGYTNSRFGQAGLENAFDPYLRGLEGLPTSVVIQSFLFYSQPPPGMDVRLSIDLHLQGLANQLFLGQTGALVLMNAQTGEILAMVSEPAFNANELTDKGLELQSDPGKPLINRAAIGLYPPGTTLGPFLLAEVMETGSLPPLPNATGILYHDKKWECTIPPESPPDWGVLVGHGCPNGQYTLGVDQAGTTLPLLYEKLGFTEAPDIQLDVAKPQTISNHSDAMGLILGEGEVWVSPLQMASAAGAMSTDGMLPAPRIALSIHSPDHGWVVLPASNARPALPETGVREAAKTLQNPNLPIWQSVGTGKRSQDEVTWYIGGTLPTWEGTPLAIALVLEEANPVLALEAGTTMLKSTLMP